MSQRFRRDNRLRDMSSRLSAVALFLAGGLVFAQSNDDLRFEIASVKPSDERGNIDLRVSPGGRLTVTNVKLGQLIREAYGLRRYQLQGGPAWIESEGFDIEAKPAEGQYSRQQVMGMLRHLLASRFGLQIRKQEREGKVFELVTAKGGPKLKDPEKRDRSFIRVYRTGAMTQTAITYILQGQDTTIPKLIENLSGSLECPVIDKTGITREFDFRMEYAADDTHVDVAPGLAEALQKELGLRLEPAKGVVTTWMIEQVQRPSVN